MLIALFHDQRVSAATAQKRVDHFCPECHQSVRKRERRGYVPHFYHLVKSNCANSGESLEHENAKMNLAEEFSGRGSVAEIECTIIADLKARGKLNLFSVSDIDQIASRRTDIIVRKPKKSGVQSYAIEIQGVNLPREEFAGRNSDWDRYGVPVLWLAILPKVLRKQFKQSEPKGEPFKIERYSPRPFERWITARCGELWFYEPEMRVAFKVRFQPHILHVDPKVFWDPSAGDMVETDGYDKVSERYVDLLVAPQVRLNDLLIDASQKIARWTT